MHRLLTSALLLASALLFTSCDSTDYEQSDYSNYQPEVSMPVRLSENARRLLPELEDAISRAGYRPTYDRGAEYQLEFIVDDGPVNADVTMRLLRRGSEVVRSYARNGGPKIIFARQQVIRASFDECLDEFVSELRSNRPTRPSYGYESRPSYGRDREIARDREVYPDRDPGYFRESPERSYDDGYDDRRY